MNEDDEDDEELEDDVDDIGEEDRTEAEGQLPGMAYSPTRLEAQQCLFRWFAKYIKRMPEQSSAVLGFGAFVHRVIERYVQKCVAAQEAADALFASEAIEEVWQAMPGISLEQYDEVSRLVHWFASHYEVRWARVVGTELNWAADRDWKPCGWDDPRARWRGRIDLLEVEQTEAVVVDWKTHRHAESQKTVAAGWASPIYANLVAAHNPALERIVVMNQYVRHQVRRGLTYTPLELQRAREMLDRAADRVDSLLVNRDRPEAWPAMPGSHCGVCGFVAVCPRRAEVQAMAPAVDAASAQRKGENILYLETALKWERDALREWVKAAAPVRVGSQVFDYWRSAKYEYAVDEIIAVCRRFGIPLAAVLKPDSKQLAAVIRASPSFGEAVAPHVADVGKVQFRHKTADADETAGPRAPSLPARLGFATTADPPGVEPGATFVKRRRKKS